jgi:hypothetical protein
MRNGLPPVVGSDVSQAIGRGDLCGRPACFFAKYAVSLEKYAMSFEKYSWSIGKFSWSIFQKS